MKICPNCESEVDNHFELCWNCNYSFTEKKVIEFHEIAESENERKIDCIRCKVPMKHSGKFKFHEGNRIGFLGNFFELLQNRESFELYHCPECGKVEFFLPEK